MATQLDLDVRVEPIKPAIGAVVHVDKETFLGDAFPQKCADFRNPRVIF